MTKSALPPDEFLRQLRNVLAVVRTIVRRTGEKSDASGMFAARINGRLDAYTFLVSELARGSGSGVDLAMLVAEQLIAYGGHEGERLSITGPDVRLTGKAAESLGLAIHELAFNAMEHGPLGQDQGQIDVSWTVSDGESGPVLQLEWRESGLAAAPDMARQGFGMDHLLKTLPYETGGRAAFAAEPASLTWTIALAMPPSQQ